MSKEGLDKVCVSTDWQVDILVILVATMTVEAPYVVDVAKK